MTRYIVIKTRVTTGKEVTYSYTEEEKAIAKMASLDTDPRYTYIYRIER